MRVSQHMFCKCPSGDSCANLRPSRSHAVGNLTKRSLVYFLARISGPAMNFSQMKDERLLLFYDAVRQQVSLDGNSPYRFAGEGVRAYADKLREEMERRRLNFTPIDWRSS